MIPEAKQPAVARALNEAFGVEDFEDICRLTAGLTSALVCRIVVRRHPYLLKVITRTDDMSDPTRRPAAAARRAKKKEDYSDITEGSRSLQVMGREQRALLCGVQPMAVPGTRLPVPSSLLGVSAHHCQALSRCHPRLLRAQTRLRGEVAPF
jgi:hypothetical protein